MAGGLGVRRLLRRESGDESPGRPSRSDEPADLTVLPRFDRRVLVVAGAVFAVLMILSPWYGWHRDELYFLDAGRHLQGGYVDQPAFTPLLARLTIDLFGVSLPGLRLWPALAAFATITIAGLTARELGGGRRAQLLTAVGTATTPVLLAVDHLEGPTAFDLLAWSGLGLVVLRVGRTGDPRWWLLGGPVLGLGLTNKHSVVFLAIAMLVGALLSGGRRQVLNWWFLGGALIAALFAVPDLVWQAGHDWATVEMTRHLNQENGGAGNIGNWVFGQLLMTTLAFIWVWIKGLQWLWHSDRPLWRSLAWAYGLLFAFFAVTTGGKIYYLAGAYIYLIAAGAVAIDASFDENPGRLRKLYGLTAITTLVSLPLVLPVLPPSDIGWTYGINQVPGESLGWPQFIQTVKTQWDALPPATRANAVIFTAEYGEAGAINELGRGDGLPIAVSAHNNEWWWGPGNPNATTVLAVAPGPVDTTGYAGYLRGFFTDVRVVATLRNPYGIHNEEWGGHVYLCTGLRKPWGQTWPELRHYD